MDTPKASTNSFPSLSSVSTADRHLLNGHSGGLIWFTGFIVAYKQSREYVRKLMTSWPYYEVYVKCSVQVCAKRDPKGLYKKASKGEIANMTGISAPYEEPEHHSLIIETDKLSLQQCVDEVIEFLLKQDLIMKTESSA